MVYKHGKPFLENDGFLLDSDFMQCKNEWHVAKSSFREKQIANLFRLCLNRPTTGRVCTKNSTTLWSVQCWILLWLALRISNKRVEFIGKYKYKATIRYIESIFFMLPLVVFENYTNMIGFQRSNLTDERSHSFGTELNWASPTIIGWKHL